MPKVIESPIQVETLRESPQTASQPAFQPEPKLEERQVRAAMQQAVQSGIDPFKLTVGDMESGLEGFQRKAQAETPVEIPEKFKTPTGEVDVEKLKASTERLDEAIQQKEAKLQDVGNFVEEQLRAYKEKEKVLRNMPNPDRLAAQIMPTPVPTVPLAPQQMSDDQLEQLIAQDLQKNPVKTIAQLVKLGIQQEMAPLNEDRRDNAIRTNLKQLAEKDVRVVEHIAAINAKLDADPDLWKLKNPHKAAWLEVKEDMRLGEPTSQVQAQPSRPSAPILGGGTPPPTPSLSEQRTSFETLNAAIGQMSRDPRSGRVAPDQQRALDQAAKEFFDSQDRFRR
jgi:hypothetical protein